jgi:molybdate transport system ATP-binding protein
VIELDVVLALAPFPLSVQARLASETVAILGPSGAGKTSLLETIAGLRPNASGRIVVDGEILMDSESGVFRTPERRRIGYVPQDACLFPHLDTASNIRFGMGRGDSSLIDEIIGILEIEPLLPRYPATLSGGERQRVALARAIATRPRLLLLDEPLAAVDVELKERILPYLLRVRESLRLPFLYVTHNAGEAAAVAEEALLLRRGAVERQGPTGAVLSAMLASSPDPDARFENIVTGSLEPRDAGAETAVLQVGDARLVVPAGPAPPPGARSVYAVAPEDIVVSTESPAHVSARNVLRGTVVSEQASGAGAWLRVAAAGTEWTVHLTRSSAEELDFSPGATAWLVIKTHAFRRLR